MQQKKGTSFGNRDSHQVSVVFSEFCRTPIGFRTLFLFLLDANFKAISCLIVSDLVSAVSDAVEKVINHFSSGATLNECSRLGDSTSSPAVAEVVLGWLCPALYAVLSDGLLPSISSAFGDISNSVWQVVEASAQQGPMTRSLNELVLRLNSEDVFAEGLLKFNAFIFGLLK